MAGAEADRAIIFRLGNRVDGDRNTAPAGWRGARAIEAVFYLHSRNHNWIVPLFTRRADDQAAGFFPGIHDLYAPRSAGAYRMARAADAAFREQLFGSLVESSWDRDCSIRHQAHSGRFSFRCRACMQRYELADRLDCRHRSYRLHKPAAE